MSGTSLQGQIFSEIDSFVDYYVTNCEEADQRQLISKLKHIHNILESYNNYIHIAHDLPMHIDELMSKYAGEHDDINKTVYVSTAIELIFNVQFFLNLINNYDDKFEVEYHLPLLLIIICMITIYEKHIEEDIKIASLKSLTNKTKIKPLIDCIELCFDSFVQLHTSNKERYDEEMSSILELLCDSNYEYMYENNIALLSHIGLRNKGIKAN
jgi:hypothetical protein